MNYNHGQFRSMAGRLAELFASEEGERILRLVTHLSASPNKATPGTELPKPGKPADTPAKLRVGTWEAVDEANGRSFVRVATGEAGHLWANVQKIPPKGPGRRVVLVGESVARGLLFDPQFNPALALQRIMNAACGPGKIDIVDLARSDLTHAPLHKLINEALHLEPDALVVFAGNNWSVLPNPSDEQVLDMMSALREAGSWRAVKELCESFLASSARQTLRLLEEIVQQRGIPVVFVLPEFNLGDWRTDCDSPPLLSSEETQEWIRTRSEAEQLLKGNDWEKAKYLGERLMQLDQGTTAAGPNILAEVSQKHGDREAARTFLQMARDASVCWPFRQTPRCFSVIQQTIREGAAAHGIHLVDLPHEFTAHLGGEAADRRLFLDYCHLTLDGIRLAMAITAETVLPLLKLPAKSRKELAEVDLKVGNNVNAGAHFLAAVHSGNWGQGIELLRHQIRKALEYDRGIARMMQLFLEVHIRRVPTSLCRSYDQLFEFQNMAAITGFFNDSLRDKFLNTKLIAAVSEGLEEFGIPTHALVKDLIIREHGVKDKAVNLVHNLYSTGSFARSLVDLRPGFFKATARNTTFPLVCDKPESLSFALTTKVPAANSEQTIALRVNGSHVADIPATDRWTTSTFSTPAGLVHPGLNQVEIDWPMPVWSVEKQREQVAECFEAGEVVEITPMFGLIHSFRVWTNAGQHLANASTE